jgi:hypothetical protein
MAGMPMQPDQADRTRRGKHDDHRQRAAAPDEAPGRREAVVVQQHPLHAHVPWVRVRLEYRLLTDKPVHQVWIRGEWRVEDLDRDMLAGALVASVRHRAARPCPSTFRTS